MISALRPERFETGAAVYGAVHKIDRETCIELTHRELLGTFAEVTEDCQAIFSAESGAATGVELAPNLLALVRRRRRPGTPAEVKITGIDHARCRVYTEIAGWRRLSRRILLIISSSGPIKHWSYTVPAKSPAPRRASVGDV